MEGDNLSTSHLKEDNVFTNASLTFSIGDPMSHISLAECYAHGKGVESSSEKAFQNYLEASKSSK